MIASEETKRRTNLGRGLSSLLGEDEPDFSAADQLRTLKTVPIEFLKANPDQPRKRFDESAIDGLVKSIEEQGVLQPLLVRQHQSQANYYEIVAGERRWRAAQRAKLHEIPVIVKNLSDSDSLEIALIENIHREDLTPLEEAEGYQRLMDEFSHTQEALSKSVGKSRSHIANMLRLLGLCDEIKSMIDDGLLSAGHGRALIGSEKAEDLAHEVIEKGLNVRQTEKLVQESKGNNKVLKKIKKILQHDPNVEALEASLSDSLGLRVEIANKSNKSGNDKGKLTVHYDTLEQLDAVIARLNSLGQRERIYDVEI